MVTPNLPPKPRDKSLRNIVKVSWNFLQNSMRQVVSKLDWIIQSSSLIVYNIFRIYQFQILFAIVLALLGYYAGIGMIIAILLVVAFCMVVFGMPLLPWLRNLTPPRRVGIIAIFAVIVGVGEVFIGKWIINQEKPNIDIISMPTESQTSPIQQYEFVIQNKNSKSVLITYITMEFSFRNNITDAILKPILNTGAPLLIGKFELNLKKKDGSELHVESQPEENVITKHCSLNILQNKANGYTINTNRLNFSCDQWSQTVVYFVDITVDLSSKPSPIVKPDGIYQGTYSYDINGRQFTEQVSGTIP